MGCKKRVTGDKTECIRRLIRGPPPRLSLSRSDAAVVSSRLCADPVPGFQGSEAPYPSVPAGALLFVPMLAHLQMRP